MKRNLPKTVAIGFLMLLAILSNAQQKGTVTDIEGNTYQTVVIGNQEWMAENLRVAKFNNGDAITNAQSNTDWENGFDTPLWSNFNNDNSYDAIYGKLYNHKVVSDNRNVCPDGWHVPSQAEWETLITGLGGASVAGGKLKATGTDYWNADNVGATNESGFNALGAGYRDGGGNFLNFNNYGDFWTSTLYSSFYAYYVSLNYNSAGTYTDYTSIAKGKSIRCIKTQEPTLDLPTLTTTTVTNITQTTASSGGAITDDGGADITAKGVVWSTSANPTVDANDGKTNDGTGSSEFSSDLTGLTPGTTYYVRAYATNSAGTGYGNEVEFTTEEEYTGETVADADGNEYPVIEIGTQKWMGKNLKTTKYNDNSTIEYPGADNTAWENNTTGAYAWYNNDEVNKTTYGALYSWYAIETNKLCPEGWHVPSKAEWEVLIAYLGGNDIAGGKIKQAGTDYWTSPNVGATNESGFAALPGGFRSSGGSFSNLNDYGIYWSSSEYTDTRGEAYYMWYNSDNITNYNYSKNLAASVRCIQDEESQVTIPVLTTTTVTNITQTTASSGGAITDDGGADITAKGVVWSTSTSPTLDANNGFTSDGTGSTVFSSDLTGLTPGTTYYVRAYATNSAGTGYGNEVQFTTSSTAPFTEPTWVQMNYQNSPIPSGYGLQAQEDSQGNVWLAVGTSIVKYTTEGQIIKYENPDATSEFSSFVLEDDNTMWVCNRSNGVFKFDVNGDWTQYNTDNTSMTSNYIHSIAIDSQGNKWITTNGGGLVKYDNSTWTIWTAENSDLPANSIYSIFIDNDDNVWLGFSGYLAKFDGTTLDVWNGEQTGYGVGGTISAISIDANDNIWIGKDWNLGVAKSTLNDLSTWTQYSYSNSDYPESRAVAIDFDAEGRVWFGTEFDGLVVFDGVDWSVFNSKTSTSWPSSSCDWVTSFFTDTKSVRWVGTHDGFILTNSIVPTVSTSNVSEVTETSAKAGGTVDFYGGADITAKGVVWSTSANPTVDANDGKTNDGTGSTEFSSDLTGLTPGTTYYVRAYATNSAGTGYGNEVQFTTEAESSVDPLPLPFNEDFEGEIHDWTIMDLDGDENKWGLYTNSDEVEVAYSGTKCAGVKYNPSGCNDWLITPLLSLPAGEEIEFSL
ncbi:MAG: hypothetical protein H5T24_02515, partial [Bacteroidales bacterium]|nr:hypothetical protein [Bacteroidales bacterium]